MKETENFHHPAGTPLKPTGEQTNRRPENTPRRKPRSTNSLDDDRGNRCGSHVGYTDEKAPSHRDREERYKWYQLEKPAQDRTR